MPDINDFTLIDAIFENPPEVSIGYGELLAKLPQKIKEILGAQTTGAYVSGIIRSYSLSEEKRNVLALSIIRVAIGKKTFAQLPATLSNELQLPMDKAQKMAGEIEKDLFDPVRNELNTFLQSQKGSMSQPSSTPPSARPAAPMRNVLDLKEITARPKQPQLPQKPASPSLPSAPKSTLQPKPPVSPKRPPSSPITPIHFT